MNNQWAKWLLIGLFVLWAFFTLGSFFAVQKPFSTANVLAVGNVLLDLLVTGWLALIALGMGSWFLQRLLPALSFIETLVLGTGLGLGMLGLLSLALGLVGLFQPLVVYGITVALSAIFAPQTAHLFRWWRRWRPENLPALWPTIYCLLITFFTLFVALLPPTDWDGLFYHLTGPKLYLQAGGIIGGIDIPHLNFPSLMEMLFAWAMLLRGDITTYRFLSKKAAWLAVLIFASMPMVSTLAGWAYNDLALAFYQFAALYAFICWQTMKFEAANRQIANRQISESEIHHSQFTIHHSPLYWLILIGVFAGLAMGLKYTSFVTPLVIVGFILWYSYRVSPITSHVSRTTHHAPRSIVTNLAVFILPALLVALPWYVKNWAFTGNPVYPFLYNVFGGQYWDGFRADWYAAAGTGVGWQPGTLLTLPWLLTLGIRDVNYWDGRTGPLLLLFLPLIVWAGFSRRSTNRPVALGPLLIFALAHFVFWTLGVIWSHSLWQSRLFLPGLVTLAPVAGWVWANLSDFDLPHFSLNRFVNIAIGLTLALTVVDVGLFTLNINPLPYLAGLETREAYLTRRLGAHYATMQRINENLPAEAAVVFLWEPRSYYCQLDCRPDSILDTFPHLVHQYGSAEAIVQAWQQAGITHVVVHRPGLEFVISETPEMVDQNILSKLEENYWRTLFDVAGAYQVYALEFTSLKDTQ
jgi:4-amino-4-deoxy-L-arabinose transferase-like glycosyltransferase